MRLPAPLALLVAAGLLFLAAPSAGAAIAYSPCPSVAGFQCGSLDVPLDRGGVVAGAVRLAVARKVAATPSTTAVVGLAGGPGQSALPLLRDFASVLAPALATRDLLMFDQRGMGLSSPLSCSLNAPTLTAAGQSCAAQLGARRGSFTSAASVADLEAVRVNSGYAKLVLYGVSYGTKVALDYAARYPANVEALVLDSVVLPQGPDPLQRSTFAAMRRVLAELCAGTECRGISGNAAGDLAGRVRGLARKPLRGLLTSARGRHQRVQINRKDLFDIVLSGDLNPTLRAELPGALTSARRGDAAPLIRLAARSAGIISFRRQVGGKEFSDAVFAATLCEEGLFPWDRAGSVSTRAQQINAFARAQGEAAYSPFDSTTALTTEMISLCVGWPNAAPAPTSAGPLPRVPTLVINGATDVRTPVEDAALVAAAIPGAQLLRVPFTGHSTLGSEFNDENCAARGLRQFFSAAAVTPCTSSDNPFSPTPVAPTKFSRLNATGRGGRIGRTITAALATAQDMRRQVIGDILESGRVPSRAGGLRGGRVTVRNNRLTLFSVTYIPGVKVSGSVPIGDGRQTLRVSGSKAARGRLTVTSRSISGTLGGRRIRLTGRAAGVATGVSQPNVRELLRSVRLRHAG